MRDIILRSIHIAVLSVIAYLLFNLWCEVKGMRDGVADMKEEMSATKKSISGMFGR